MRIMSKWRMYAEFADGSGHYYSAGSEEDCMYLIASDQAKHGECLMYTGVNDEDYVDGEYVGRENFIYS